MNGPDPTGSPRLQVAVSGAGGMIGTRLVSALRAAGHVVTPLVRHPVPDASQGIPYDPARGTIDARRLEGLDAVIHLAGASIASGRWTGSRRREIVDSRVDGTRLIATTLARIDRPPRVLVSASAVGYYGDRGAEVLTESSPPGTGFLAEVCEAWEAAAAPAAAAGARVVHPRIGVVLSASGGMLGRLLTPFRLGLGGPVGNGRQFVSWIGEDDLVAALRHALVEEALSGPFNATAPHPLTNEDFARTLGRMLGRPARLRVPAALVSLGLGQMGRELLLGSTRALPRRLEETGFRFTQPTLEMALAAALAR